MPTFFNPKTLGKKRERMTKGKKWERNKHPPSKYKTDPLKNGINETKKIVGT